MARVAETPLVLVVRTDSPARTLADLISAAKAKPGDTSFASTGMGSTLHLAGELLQPETGTQMLHVPYKGSAPALNGVLGGETQFMIDSVGSSIPLIKGGKLRALAVTSAKRLPALPDVPTVAESGVPGFDVSTWFGLHGAQADAGGDRQPAQRGGRAWRCATRRSAPSSRPSG